MNVRCCIRLLSLSPAHSAKSGTAFIGAHNLHELDDDALIVHISQFFEHPLYKVSQVLHDIAVVKLDEKISYTGELIAGSGCIFCG